MLFFKNNFNILIILYSLYTYTVIDYNITITRIIKNVKIMYNISYTSLKRVLVCLFIIITRI